MAAATIDVRIAALKAWGQPLGSWLARHRRVLLIACAGLFLGGTVWSAAQTDASRIELAPVAAMALLAAPLTLLHGALALVLLGRAARVPAGLAWATRTSAYGQLAELLPLPGGAIVRAGALVAAGSTAGNATLLVLTSALLWVALAALAAGLYLLTMPGLSLAGASLSLAGGIGTLTFAGVLWLRAGLANAALTLVHRIAGLGIAALRLSLAFAAIGAPLAWSATLPFVLANVAGSAAAIAPGGLGISEALAALLAGPIAVVPAAAFLAVALDRIVSATFVAVVVGALQFRR